MEDYKEKYEKALERAKLCRKNGFSDGESLEDIFPELKESEDERIRKEILEYFQQFDNKELRGVNISDWISWLEKQKDEQKTTTDNNEPKFKVGDWIISNDESVHEEYRVCRIEKIEDDRYYIDNGDFLAKSTLEEFDYHLWTVKDAKDGDVLAASDGSIFIFKEAVDGGCKYYIALEKDNETINVNDNLEHFWEAARGVKPSTKEQRDLLFSKMKEAGYEWNAEKKELKKIEEKFIDKIVDCEKPLLERFKQAVYDCAWEKVTCKVEGESQEEYANRWAEQLLILVRDWADDYIDSREDVIRRRSFDKGKQSIQKPAWSEEDEKYYDSALWHIKNSSGIEGNIYNWLKSLRERMKGE